MKQLLWVLSAILVVGSPLSAKEKKKPKSFEVPYRLTIPKHILIRAKLNGKGPFNFILDTGAPALFFSTKAAESIGVKPDKNGWGTFDTLEIEGGVVYKNAKGRIEDPFQLKGMNGMGLAGAELHGVIGYNLLAQYQMTFDFTKSKMLWTKLNWKPQPPKGMGGKRRGGQGGLEIVGKLMGMLGGFLGRKANPDYDHQGFLGFEVSEKEGVVKVTNVMENSPAQKAGLQVGDHIRKFGRRSVYGIDGLQKYTNKVTAGDKVELRVLRGEDKESVELTLTAGEGL